MGMRGQVLHHAQLLLLIHQGHYALVNAQRLQVGQLDLIFHIHQRITDPVNIILRHYALITEWLKG